MKMPARYELDTQLLAEHVRAKRGNRGLREIEKETTISIAVLSRVENGKIPDQYNFGLLCAWLEENPALFYRFLEGSNDDPIVGQLRAAANMSAETANAFMDIIRAAYAEILEAISEEDMA